MFKAALSDESASNIRNLIHQKTEQTVIFLEKGAYDFNTPSIAEITGTVVIIGRYSDAITVRCNLYRFLKSQAQETEISSIPCSGIPKDSIGSEVQTE